MRDLSAHAQSDQTRGDAPAGEEAMIATRRAFLKTSALGGASLIIGFNRSRLFAADSANEFKPNGWVKIDRDGTVTLTIGKSEMGQGVRTALAMMLADEL